MPESEQQRLDGAKALWADVVATGYVETDASDPLPAGLSQILPAIRRFLLEESVQVADRPNLVRSLLLTVLPAGEEAEANAIYQLYLELGLALGARSDNPDVRTNVISGIFRRLNDHVQRDGTSYVAATGPYSSVYAALLALVADEMTVRAMLDRLASRLERPDDLGLTRPVYKPGPLFWRRYYRGQAHDWPVLPKLLRAPEKKRGLIGTMIGAVGEGLGAAKFDLAVASARNEALTRDQRTAVRQHYGFATSMLDFTESIEVAAFFATRNADTDDIGVVYRYHFAHPWALDLRGSLAAGWQEVADIGAELTSLAAHGLKPLKLVHVPGIERITRQHGVFFDGIGVAEAHAFMQPVYFRQRAGVSYGDASRHIDANWLFPQDDTLDALSTKIRGA